MACKEGKSGDLLQQLKLIRMYWLSSVPNSISTIDTQKTLIVPSLRIMAV